MLEKNSLSILNGIKLTDVCIERTKSLDVIDTNISTLPISSENKGIDEINGREPVVRGEEIEEQKPVIRLEKAEEQKPLTSSLSNGIGHMENNRQQNVEQMGNIETIVAELLVVNSTKEDTYAMVVDESAADKAVYEPADKLKSRKDEEVTMLESRDEGKLEVLTPTTKGELIVDEPKLEISSSQAEEIKKIDTEVTQKNEEKLGRIELFPEDKENNITRNDTLKPVNSEPLEKIEVPANDFDVDKFCEYTKSYIKNETAEITTSQTEEKLNQIPSTEKFVNVHLRNEDVTDVVATSSSTNSTAASTGAMTPYDSVKESVLPMARVKRLAEAEELEGDRDGRISSSNSGCVSQVENIPDCKRIRFDESIFEEDERERLIREFVECSTDSIEEIAKNCEKLQLEIMALGELAIAKELKWNSIIRVLKLKEEMLERILFKKRNLDDQSNKSEIYSTVNKVYRSITSSMNYVSKNPTKTAREDSTSSAPSVSMVPFSLAEGILSSSSAQELLKNNISISAVDSANKSRLHRTILPKSFSSSSLRPPSFMSSQPVASSSWTSSQNLAQTSIQPVTVTSAGLYATKQPYTSTSVAQTLPHSVESILIDQNSVIGEGRQGPIVDVKSIIADFRSKNPDLLPGRGRRNSLSFTSRGPDPNSGPRFNMKPNNVSSSIANMTLGSGAYLRNNVSPTMHNDHRSSNMYLAQDSPLSAALNRSDLQIRPAILDSLLFSLNNASPSTSSQPSNSSIVTSGNNFSTASAAAANNSIHGANNNSFQEVLVKLEKTNEKQRGKTATGLLQNMSLSNKNLCLPPPPPYPEVTLHPVVVSQYQSQGGPSPSHTSLLHGILTKPNLSVRNNTLNSREWHTNSSIASGVSNGLSVSCSFGSIQHRPTTFSPTLARLLSAPDKSRGGKTNVDGTSSRNVKSSINDILTSNKKSRTEITITPVTSTAKTNNISSVMKNGSDVVLDEDDDSKNMDRLTDERRDMNQTDLSSNVIPADQVPECQGCHKEIARFVCAGCGNQWYCSRECQVNAWEEHSEVCSG